VRTSVYRLAFAGALFLVAGCAGNTTAPATDTGAKDTARIFFEALIAHDPPRAYAVLEQESRRRVSSEQFGKLAKSYSDNVGFPAEKVVIQACEEQGDSATAHVVLMGHGAGHSRRYADGATLRRTDGRWGVVLPANFGHKTRP
jgi:hypothetical protein